MKKWFVTMAGACLLAQVMAGSDVELDLTKKQVTAVRSETSITLDGSLDEPEWLAASIATEFTQQRPHPGREPSQRTEVKLIYDNSGLYIGARMYESRPDSILQELTQRDQLRNTDWFGIFLDPYRDGNNGLMFIVTPSGVQLDAKITPGDLFGDWEIVRGEDMSWDAVWESKTRIDAEGWVAEIKIPYSAIRFPKVEEQIWHVNFGRMIRRLQEQSYWSTVDPEKNGFLNQAGYLRGIRDIKSPIRLQATPFVAIYGEHFHDRRGDPKNSFGRSFNGGMDLKYGINDAFTLDLTLIPDFGEAQSDNQVLNLSPFEVRFDENRQFFTEGTELFNKGGLFYSRRIGGRPLHFDEVEENLAAGEEIIENPQTAQLYNATKISGRTSEGLGIGFFNATSGRSVARVRNSEGHERTVETDPLTNYNVLVFDQNLKNNSYVSLVNTTVLRDGTDYDANVTGTVFSLRNKDNSYMLEGNAALSQKYYPGQTDLGHAYTVGLTKMSGNINFGIFYAEESDAYDPNDLGFNFSNNQRTFENFVGYNRYKPFWKFNRAGFGAYHQYARLYAPSAFTEYGVNLWAWAQTQSFWNINFFSYHSPFTGFDYFEPRTEGRYYRTPAFGNYGVFINTDSRKRLRLGFNFRYLNHGEPGRHMVALGVFPRFRVNDKLNFGLEFFRQDMKNDAGYVDKATAVTGTDDTGAPLQREDIIFGRRNRVTFDNILITNYTFNNAMALTFRMRHYWSKVEYHGFHLLDEDGYLVSTDYNQSQNTNFNAFNIDAVFRWRFAPGSDMFVIWKNSILNDGEFVQGNYFDNLNGLFGLPQSNSLSVKLIYFLDYANFVRG